MWQKYFEAKEIGAAEYGTVVVSVEERAILKGVLAKDIDSLIK